MTAKVNSPVLHRIQIEPTNRCNFRCGYCRRTHWARPVGEMSLARLAILLAKLPPVRHIHLQGVGEPLLNRELAAMVRLIREKGMGAGTSTNASLLTRAKSAALLDAGINRINLSLDTLDAGELGRVRKGARLDMILDNIATLAAVRDQGRYAGCELAIACVAQQSTIHDLPRLVERAASLGLDEVYVQNLNSDFLPSDYVAAQGCAQAGLETYREATRQAGEVASRLGIRFLAPELAEPDFGWRCRWPFLGCNITWDGFVSPCCLQPDPDILNFGNLFDADFQQIWRSQAYELFRADVRAGKAAICSTCPDLHGQMWHPAGAPFPADLSTGQTAGGEVELT